MGRRARRTDKADFHAVAKRKSCITRSRFQAWWKLITSALYVGIYTFLLVFPFTLAIFFIRPPVHNVLVFLSRVRRSIKKRLGTRFENHCINLEFAIKVMAARRNRDWQRYITSISLHARNCFISPQVFANKTGYHYYHIFCEESFLFAKHRNLSGYIFPPFSKLTITISLYSKFTPVQLLATTFRQHFSTACLRNCEIPRKLKFTPWSSQFSTTSKYVMERWKISQTNNTGCSVELETMEYLTRD